MTSTGHELTFAVRVAACGTTITLHCNNVWDKQKSSPARPCMAGTRLQHSWPQGKRVGVKSRLAFCASKGKSVGSLQVIGTSVVVRGPHGYLLRPATGAALHDAIYLWKGEIACSFLAAADATRRRIAGRTLWAVRREKSEIEVVRKNNQDDAVFPACVLFWPVV